MKFLRSNLHLLNWFKKSGGDTPANLQTKNVTITEDGTQVIKPDDGYNGLKKVSVTTTVAEGIGEELDIINGEVIE